MPFEPETKMGGPGDRFPTSTWSGILTCAGPHSPARREALHRLVSLYWRPVYRFIRTSRCRSVEDAKDLTQEFFCYLLEENAVESYRKEKGKFRHFLKGILRNFLADSHRRGRAQKRGGDLVFLPLDVSGLETEPLQVESRELGPDGTFDRQWTAELVAQTVRKLEEVLTNEGKTLHFAVYRSYELRSGDPADVTYEGVGRAYGLSAGEVKSVLQLARARFRALLIEAIWQTASTQQDLIEELNELFSGA